MRRILLAGAAILCFAFFFGCSAGGKTVRAEDVNYVFSCKADVTCANGTLTCAFRRAGQQDATVEILSGSGKGLKWYWSGDGFTQTYQNLSARSETCVLPEGSFAPFLVEALDYAEKAGTLESRGDNVFTGSLNGRGFSLTVDGKTGNIQNFSAPDWNFEIKFHDFEEPVLQTYVPEAPS